jgi:hypothetical protein
MKTADLVATLLLSARTLALFIAARLSVRIPKTQPAFVLPVAPKKSQRLPAPGFPEADFLARFAEFTSTSTALIRHLTICARGPRWSQDSVPLLVDEDLIFNRRNAFIHNDKTLVPDRVHPQLRGEKIWRTLYLPVLTFTQHWSSKTKHISPKVFPWKKPGITSVRHVEQEWVPGGT